MKSTLLITIVLFLSFVLITRLVLGDSKFERENHRGYNFWEKKPGVRPVTNVLYRDECGACHFAYQPGLLPAASWITIMADLANHFGDNAELEPADIKSITQYLNSNSAEKSDYRRSIKIMRSLRISMIPKRITVIPYFLHEHDEIPSYMVNNNTKVGSLSHCDKCHLDAKNGIYSESGISIPGYGHWHD